MKFKECIADFAEKAKEIINYLESLKLLTGEQKKKRLDNDMLEWALAMIDKVQMNWIAKIVIKNGLKICIPAITQAIFDLIETRIKGITDNG